MKNMNLTKWASIAEIISSIAILITLVYLAIQTKQNTDAVTSQSRHSLFQSAQFEQTIWMQYPELSALIVDNSLPMTFHQKVQLDALMIMSFTRRQFAFRQFQAGQLDKSVWNTEVQVISLLLGTERTRSWWDTMGKTAYEKDFIVTVNSIIQGQPYHPYWNNLANWDSKIDEDNNK